jgi:pimeloyl-ACP methyl ester carboxylesterase
MRHYLVCLDQTEAKIYIVLDSKPLNRSYAELFTAQDFSNVVLVDQSPLQNYTSDGEWGPDRGNKSCNSTASLAHIQATLKYRPEDVYNSTISSCLAYLSHPQEGDDISEATMASDRDFFLSIAKQGDPKWFGKLMADHTSLDWRDSIAQRFHPRGRVLVIASSRSGCFPPAGPLRVVDLLNSESFNRSDDPLAVGVTIDWGGHWCYWENPEKFNTLVLDFLAGKRISNEAQRA